MADCRRPLHWWGEHLHCFFFALGSRSRSCLAPTEPVFLTRRNGAKKKQWNCSHTPTEGRRILRFGARQQLTTEVSEAQKKKRETDHQRQLQRVDLDTDRLKANLETLQQANAQITLRNKHLIQQLQMANREKHRQQRDIMGSMVHNPCN